MRNIELKARLKDLDTARRVAEAVATDRLPTEHQVDTYFPCRFGRLKLREIAGRRAELICYARPDQQGPKGSDYELVPIAEADKLKSVLSAALGISKVVAKRREIFLYHNVRIHLDRVEHLGTFLEFEAVVEGDVDDATAEQQVQWLSEQFGIGPDDRLPGSYADMIG